MMPMFHQGGRAGALLNLNSASFVRQSGSFTYNDSPYVHALNRALQLEQAALSLYTEQLRLQKPQSGHSKPCDERSTCHNYAHRQLVRLIFAQRGLPDSGPISFTALTTTIAARASRWIPGTVHTPVFGVSAQRIESALLKRYDSLLMMAPLSDQEVLQELRQQTRDFSLESL